MLLSFVKVQLKLTNFDGMSKSSAIIIINFWISQGNVGTQLIWGGTPCNSYIDSLLRNVALKEFCKPVYVYQVMLKLVLLLFYFETQFIRKWYIANQAAISMTLSDL